MDTEKNESPPERGISSGPLRIYSREGKLFVTGFGLWIPVRSEGEGQALIRELEDEGFHICY